MHTLIRLTLSLAFITLHSGHAAAGSPTKFESAWKETPDRMWIGPDCWANRLHDWQVRGGRLVCDSKRPGLGLHTLHLLTRQLSAENRALAMSVTSGLRAGNAETGRAGFLVGVGRGEMDQRAAALVQMGAGPGGGILACIDREGRLQIRDNTRPGRPVLGKSEQALPPGADVRLTLILAPVGENTSMSLVGRDVEGSKTITATAVVSAKALTGNLALARETGGKNTAPRWFSGWKVSGERLVVTPDQAFGPIACTQYTLSRGVLKLTAQMLPIGDSEEREVALQVRAGGQWKTIATSRIRPSSYIAPFRVEDWDDTDDVAYRVVWGEATWEGTVRRDPRDKRQVVVAGFTGNHNNGHGFGKPGYNYLDRIYFPHADLMERVDMHEPDLLFFSGDQVYEGDSPTPADRPHIIADYLYKWLLWCWAYRDYTRDIPCICLPDDHDVYQGNLWGQGGRKTPRGQGSGGYVHAAAFVKAVEETQTSHLPDPVDPTPVDQGIGVYYTSMVYGDIGFAIIEDRKFKSGLEDPGNPGKLLGGTDRPELWNRPDLAKQLFDQPGKILLGKRQLDFLHDFARDWRGQKMKVCLSQTIFAGLATHHGGMQWMTCDLDSNGWPQTGRRKAVDALRRGFVFHLAGDQHLATLAQHGIDAHRDANWSFCVPSICNFYPRAWAPELGPHDPYKFPTPDSYTGDRRDSLGNLVTVHAVSNPGRDTGRKPSDLHDRMPGYGIVKIDRETREFITECWPRHAVPGKDSQYPGWPRTISMESNYGREARAWLPTLEVTGLTDPVVQVIDESNDEVLYTLRINGASYRPKTFKPGTYTVRIGNPDTNTMKTLKGLEASPEITTRLRVGFDD